MPDSTIGDRPRATHLDAESLFIVEQQGEALAVAGALFIDFAKAAAAAEAEKAAVAAEESTAAAQTASTASEEAVSAKDEAVGAKDKAQAAQSAAETAAEESTAAAQTASTASEEAVSAKDEAQAAQQAIENMKVEGATVSPDTPASVEKVTEDGVVKLTFGIPQGEQGEPGFSGVHFGSDDPPETANVWINPNGQPTGTENWEFDMADDTTDTKTVVVIGADEANGELAILKFRRADGTWGEIPAIVGTSATHQWDGTTLTVTSASGTSSADLKGESGVYIGPAPAPDWARVWINPDENPTSTEEWEFEMESGGTETKTVVVL